MAEITTRNRPWADFLGIPVLVQLKGPMVGVVVRRTQGVGYADDKAAQWIPEPLGDDAGPTATQMIMFAVLRDAHDQRFLIMDWQAFPPNSAAPLNPPLRNATISTIVPMDSIAYVTRIVDVIEPSRIIP